MSSDIITKLKKWELPFLVGLFALNLYCAFMVNPLPIMEGGIDILHLSLAAVMLMMAGDRLQEKINKDK
jgi:peptidoglycan/LPS O-acetylase OafA/YrhL